MIFKFILFCVLFLNCVLSESNLVRQKRFLIVPPTSPTRHQWIVGIGIPLELDNIAVTSGYVYKAQYFMATKAEQLRPLYTWDGFEKRSIRNIRSLDPNATLIDAFTGRKYESYDVEPVLVKEETINDTSINTVDGDFWDDEDHDDVDDKAAYDFWHPTEETTAPERIAENSRWNIYEAVAALARNHGIGDKSCVLRMICEAAEMPISSKSGILGELLHILLTPSTSKDTLQSEEDADYSKAEKLGRSGASCEEEFRYCKKSFLSSFTTIQNPFDTIFSLLQ